MYFLKRHAPWISSLIVGVLLLASGLFMALAGLTVRNEIRDELRSEQVMTAEGTESPGVLIEDAETARMQAELIKEHTTGTWGPYQQLPAEDPRRAAHIDGLTLRTALNVAVMGLGITDLV